MTTEHTQKIRAALTNTGAGDDKRGFGSPSGVHPYCQPNDEKQRVFMLKFGEPEMGVNIYYDENEAREAFAKAEVRWNCHLFGTLPRKNTPTVNDAEGEITADDVVTWAAGTIPPRSGALMKPEKCMLFCKKSCAERLPGNHHYKSLIINDY